MMSIADKLRAIAKGMNEKADALDGWSKPIAALFAPKMHDDASRLNEIADAVEDAENLLAGWFPK